MTRWCRALVVIAALHIGTELPGSAAVPAGGSQLTGSRLTGEDALVRVYEFILDARFDQAQAELRRACGPAPVEACHVLEATALWWRIMLDPLDRTFDEEFEALVARAIRTTEAWTEREPDNAEAWFYLGGAYAARVPWRVMRDEKLAAARDGKRIKQALERALELNPNLHDAHFGIGLYKYYADVAPAAARILRFLFLLPGGDREEGLREMLQARRRGRLLQGEAAYQLHLIYLWYEDDPATALELLAGLTEHYPGNPLFVEQMAEIQYTYLHDITGSLDTWRSLLARAVEQRINAAGLAEVRARLAIAHHLDVLHQTDRAIEQLEQVVALEPKAPYAALALAQLRLGEAHDRLGSRNAALTAYRGAIAATPPDDPLEIKDEARDRMRRRPDERETEAYRLSLAGWRRLENGDLDGAARALMRSIALNPDDPVAHYRYGRVLQARGDDVAALAAFERAVRGARDAPAPIIAAAFLEAARLRERAGQLDAAIAWYRVAATYFGAAKETHAAAARALARLEK